MIALISDIHGNYEALKAVFDDIDAQKADEVFFLGDVVGYGPEPEACIDLLENRCSVLLMGNHDFAMLNVPTGFNPIAAGAIWCLKARMEPGMYSMPWKRRRWKFLGELQHRRQNEGQLFVHASPRNPINEYVLPDDPMHNPEKIEGIFTRVEHLAFFGHTHFPGVITEQMGFQVPRDLDHTFVFTKEKALINIGSVGQPRDRNPDACYALLYEDRVVWRRVPYDVETTIEKIKVVECLHPRNAERLREGR